MDLGGNEEGDHGNAHLAGVLPVVMMMVVMMVTVMEANLLNDLFKI